jgi:pimeloyl-ACP methyl ester carboxylesterase
MRQSQTKTPLPRRRRASEAMDWALHAKDALVLGALAGGQHRDSLREYFGTAAYEELSALATTAKRVKRLGGPRVLIVPGMMGSRLCCAKRGGARRGGEAKLLWIDPLSIAAGRLKDLKLPSVKSIRPMGVLLFSYAKLKLKLEIEGFDAKFFPYDWRLGIDELGSTLASYIAAQGRPVVLIAHSMGGLIARIATNQLPKRDVVKLIMLGTPNRGSFAPVQALRGTYPFVRKLARMDSLHSPEYLAAQVFCTFPGLYHMLPATQGRSTLDLLDPDSWPGKEAKPQPKLLRQAAAVRERLAVPDTRMTHIVGVNRETVVSVRRQSKGFEYNSSMNGDGTVPVAMALVPRLKTYFVEESHGNLANNPAVIRAIIDLMQRGSTRELARRFAPKRDRLTRTSDTALRRVGRGKIDWRRLDSAQREAALADLDGRHLLSLMGAAQAIA